MNKATLQRFYHDKVTVGRLTFDWLPNLPIIYTLELPWDNNKPFVSCITQGLYNVTPHNTKDKPNTFEVLNVPGRAGILFHAGNYACNLMIGTELKHSETEGCILVGLGYDKIVPMLKNSVSAMELLNDNIKGNWCVEIRNLMPPSE